MEQGRDNHGLVITASPLLLGFARACIHTNRTLDEADAFFRWCSDYPNDPITGLLEPAQRRAGQQWRELVIAQSMDMFADQGMNAVNWTGTLIEALGQVSHLSSPGNQMIRLEGFVLDFQRSPGPEHPHLRPAHETPFSLPAGARLPGLVSLTMDGVSRGLSLASAHIGPIASLLDRLNLGASRVEHSMLASALLTLVAIGPITGYSRALVGGPADPWHALMSWDLPSPSPMPISEAIDLLDQYSM